MERILARMPFQTSPRETREFLSKRTYESNDVGPKDFFFMSHEHKAVIHHLRHGEKPENILPQDITTADIQKYRDEHELGPQATDNDVAQLLITERGGPVYADQHENQPLNVNDRTHLTYAGIRDAQALASEIFKEAERLPRGRIYLFLASPAGRTRETQDVLEDRIEHLIKTEKVQNLQTVKIKNLEELSVGGVGAKTDVTSFIFMEEGAEEIGPWNQAMLTKMSDAFGGETASELLWFARPAELVALKEELRQRFPAVSAEFIERLQPKDYLTTPEERIGKIIAYFIRLLEIAQNDLPGRSVEIYAISHNIILDATTIRLLGLEVSVEGAKKMGAKAREPLEAGKIVLQNGEITIMFRGLRKTLSVDDLKNIQHNLKDELLARKRQWGVVS